MGFLISDITVTGKSASFGVPELGVDALKAGHAVLSALWAYSAGLERFAPHPLVGRPFLLVTEIKAGGYIAVPGECRISLILKLIPGQSLDDAKAGLEAAVHSAPLDSEIRLAFAYPAGRDHPVGGTPTETPEATPFVRLLAAAVRSVRPDRGAIEGAPYWSEAPFLATELGVPTIYWAPGDIRRPPQCPVRWRREDQDLALAERQPVYMNMFLGRELSIPWVGKLRRGRMIAETEKLMSELDVRIPSATATVSDLSGGQRQGIAIARATHWASKLVLMDEPTAALGIAETERVERIILSLKARFLAILIISHNLDQVFRLADRICVLRRGRQIGIRDSRSASRNEVVSMITGLSS